MMKILLLIVLMGTSMSLMAGQTNSTVYYQALVQNIETQARKSRIKDEIQNPFEESSQGFPSGYKLPSGIQFSFKEGLQSLNKEKRLPKPLLKGFKCPLNFDPRINAIVRNPKLLWKLDQRYVFSIDKFYGVTLKHAIKASGHFLPYVFYTENTNKLITALCVIDKKVFFWLPETDQNLVGWIPLISKDAFKVPQKNGTSLFGQY